MMKSPAVPYGHKEILPYYHVAPLYIDNTLSRTALNIHAADAFIVRKSEHRWGGLLKVS